MSCTSLTKNVIYSDGWGGDVSVRLRARRGGGGALRALGVGNSGSGAEYVFECKVRDSEPMVCSVLCTPELDGTFELTSETFDSLGAANR
jgi:hypothetical protein